MTTASEVLLAVLPSGIPPHLVTRFDELQTLAQALTSLVDSTSHPNHCGKGRVQANQANKQDEPAQSVVQQIDAKQAETGRPALQVASGLDGSPEPGSRSKSGPEVCILSGESREDTIMRLHKAGLCAKEISGVLGDLAFPFQKVQSIIAKSKRTKPKQKRASHEPSLDRSEPEPEPKPSLLDASVLDDPLADAIIEMHQSGLPRFKIARLLAEDQDETRTEDEIKAIISAWRSRL
jgi:hypothetical protein